ncbi:MAG: SDR family NAD(P)-dependent oxidoreductase [Thermoguttaceae bacterium]|jgi:NAD(P)-dependent dehydrogenase (short-subunit alcohol dehydrogenase family)
MGYWKDKIVLVTGGSNGFGRVIAETFGAAGAKLAIVGLESNDVAETAEEMRADGLEVMPLVADVTKPEDAQRLVDETIDRYGALDALVNAAGRTHRGFLMKTPLDEFESLWRLNVMGTIACTQAAYPHLIKRKGHVVNIGSLAAKSAARWVGGYPVTKHAVAAFSQQLRLESKPDGLHVLLVCPGPVKRKNPRLYALKEAEGIPESALMPGGGVKVGKLDPQRLARKILKYCEKGRPELVAPAKARLLFSISQLCPRLGDWIVLKST